MTFFASIRTSQKRDKKDRVHRFYIAEVGDEEEARNVLKAWEPTLYNGDLETIFMSDYFERCEAGPQVITFGTYLESRQDSAT